MGKIVFMFSGQGAQYSGMGRELYETSPSARAVFTMAEAIRPGTAAQCFSGGSEELQKTENTQPCLYCVDLAAAAALCEAGVNPDMLAGFSLGEFAALAFSGAVSYEDGFKLVCARARLMQEASEQADAGMAAVLKLPDDSVIKLCGGFTNVYPVNFNCSGQVVVSGKKDELELFRDAVKAAGGRFMPLKTGGGFHSPFMAKAAEAFRLALDAVSIGAPSLPLYSNVTAKPYGGDLPATLGNQMTSPVLWREEAENMIRDGADTFVEVGPGKTLCGLIGRISDSVSVFGVENSAGLTETVKILGKNGD